ncbi:TPA: glutathione S-transferase, partial [Vibrio vulnificus]
GIFGGESGLQEVGLCGIHPLTQRYDNYPHRIQQFDMHLRLFYVVMINCPFSPLKIMNLVLEVRELL